jgi:TolB-like protein
VTTPDIFLSYNREDAATAKRFADAFAAEGLNVWWDTALRSGEAYDEVTEAALRGAKAVVVLWSPRSVVSRWVRAEATIADRCKTLVPVTIEPCERPIMFELTQTAELSHWDGAPKDKAWLAFLGDVRRFVGREAIATQATAASPRQALAPAASGDRPVLAILPFKGTFETEFGEDLGERLTDEIVTALSRYKYLLKVQTDAAACEYVLEGTLRRSGERIFLSARLQDVREGTPIWAERLDDGLAEVSDSPEDLANRLVAQIATVIEATETRRASTQAIEGASTYQLLLGALHAVRGFSRDSMDHASAMLERALEKVPDDPYVLALASLANGLKVSFHWASDRAEAARLAQDYMRRALQRGGDDPQVLGWAAVGGTNSGGDIATLDAMIDQALVRNPGWFYLWHFSGQTKLCRGNLDAAIAHFENSLRMEPWSPDRWAVLAGLGMARVLSGNYEIALAPLLEAEQLLPGTSGANIGLVAAYVYLGRIEDARSARRRVAFTFDNETFDYYRNPAHQAFLRDAWSKAA